MTKKAIAASQRHAQQSQQQSQKQGQKKAGRNLHACKASRRDHSMPNASLGTTR